MKDARAILRFRFPKGAPKGVELQNDPADRFAKGGKPRKRGFPLTCDLFYLFSSEREKNRN